MELYTLGKNFLKMGDPLEHYTSVIWTERYSVAGDVSLVVKATAEMIQKLAKGTFVYTPESQEVMWIKTHSIENGLLTVTGPTLLLVLNDRLVWQPTFRLPNSSGAFMNYSPGMAITWLVEHMAINTEMNEFYASDYHLDWDMEKITGLSLGEQDVTGMEPSIVVGTGYLYDTIKDIAEAYKIGMSLYLESATESGFSLKFKTYRGIDRTGWTPSNPTVRFSPVLNSLTDIKELSSLEGHKNVAYVYKKDFPLVIVYGNGVETEIPKDFDRRVLFVPVEEDPPTTLGPSALHDWFFARGTNALANYNYTRVVDGSVTSQSEFKFGEHYNLGDLVELEGHSGAIQRARITEYIRSKDQNGRKDYPTIAVVD